MLFPEHVQSLKSLQEHSSASLDAMEKDYLDQLESLEDENEKLKASVGEGNDLLAQCQRALTQASQKSTTLAVRIIGLFMVPIPNAFQDQLEQSRVLQQHTEQENHKIKHHILILEEELSNSKQRCHQLEAQIEDYSLASKYILFL